MHSVLIKIYSAVQLCVSPATPVSTICLLPVKTSLPQKINHIAIRFCIVHFRNCFRKLFTTPSFFQLCNFTCMIDMHFALSAYIIFLQTLTTERNFRALLTIVLVGVHPSLDAGTNLYVFFVNSVPIFHPLASTQYARQSGLAACS